MPTPNAGEGHDEFIERCMSDDEAVDDFPDENQRLAFCESVWEQEANMSDQKKETRTFPLTEVRVQRDDEDPRIVGHAAVFDRLSEDLGGFREKVAPGAFADTLDSDVRALINHNVDHVLGRTKAGTLSLDEDDRGLAVEIDPPDTQAGRDLMVSMERGDIDQMSFGFRTLEDSWEEVDGEDVRTLEKVELLDVSPVTFPAYPDTSVAVREHREWRDERVAERYEEKKGEERGDDAAADEETGRTLGQADADLRLADAL